MKYVIVGGVAGGATVASRLRRMDEQAEIILFERGKFISYANCGLPYYIGGTIAERGDLLVQTEAGFKARYRVDVRTRHEVTRIFPDRKKLAVQNIRTGEKYEEEYDKLILSTGGFPYQPAIGGISNPLIFTLRSLQDVDFLKKFITNRKPKKVVVVGGGATGLGVAVDAASRGYSVALLEKTDFAKCTSSRSTKLVHGGVRYLQHGDVMLVLEALRERGRMKANAPHLVKDQAFVISNYSYWDNFLYFCGLTFYDMLSFGFGYGRSKFISAKKVMKYIPTSVEKGLKGGVVYHDGQFDDSRMAVNLAQTCVEQGGVVVNQATVTGILHNAEGKVSGVKFSDNLSGKEYILNARSVVNAAGCFVDDIMHMDSPEHRKMVTPSQGVHLVLDMKFLQSDYAIMVPKTSDGRVLFAVPWHDKVVVGTTDIVRPTAEEEPKPLKEEIADLQGYPLGIRRTAPAGRTQEGGQEHEGDFAQP